MVVLLLALLSVGRAQLDPTFDDAAGQQQLAEGLDYAAEATKRRYTYSIDYLSITIGLCKCAPFKYVHTGLLGYICLVKRELFMYRDTRIWQRSIS